jgi:hypothetical protein
MLSHEHLYKSNTFFKVDWQRNRPYYNYILSEMSPKYV